jgi:endonuclease/exonuclease/phosphatase family metal-dependent hydrolase
MLGNKTLTKIILGEWNVRTLLDRPEQTSRPERRTALVARELKRYNIDIAALSETRLSESGYLTEELGGYTFYWSGKKTGEKRDHGVGFAIKSSLAKILPNKPVAINERLGSLRIPLCKNRHLLLITAYAPTLSYPPEDKDIFYHQLYEAVQKGKKDKLIILGDFNARVGSNFKSWSNVLGPYGTGKINENGERLLTFCSENNLMITNTIFKQPACRKGTWIHPRSKQEHQIDYIITRQSDRADILSTRVMRGANCNTDHLLLRSKVRLNINRERNKRGGSANLNLNVGLLKAEKCKTELETAITSNIEEQYKLDEHNTTSDRWNQLKDILQKTSLEVLGKKKRQHQDWFDENDTELQKLLKSRNETHVNLLSSRATRSNTKAYKEACRHLQQATRSLKSKCWDDKAEEIQMYADTNNLKGFYASLKEVWGPQTHHNAQLRSADGNTILSEPTAILSRWADHFNTL